MLREVVGVGEEICLLEIEIELVEECLVLFSNIFLEDKWRKYGFKILVSMVYFQLKKLID